MKIDLAGELRNATRDLHRQVERAGIMPELLRGELPVERYCALLRNLRDLYAAMESALHRRAALPAIAAVVQPALFRTRALEGDLRFLYGQEWEHLPTASATRDYVERLRDVEETAPERLVAHAYVRYLGDLSGGQVVRRVLCSAYGLPGQDGLTFYAFGDHEAMARSAASFRAGLNSAALEPHTAAVVDEARHAFGLHARLFEELAAAPNDALSRRG